MSYFRSPIGLFVLFFIVFSTACQESSSPPERQTTTPKAEPIVDHRQQVRGLADEIWADTLERSTYLRLQEGLPITFFEVPTLERHRENLKNNLRWRERLEAIDATALEGDELITYEILAFQLANDGTNDDDYWLQFDITPYVSPYLVRFSEQALAGHQFMDKAAADHYLKLVGDYAAIVEHLSQKVEGQIERGIYLPVPALASTRATWEGIMATAPAALSVAEARLGNLSEEERGAFQPALEALITERIVPGYGRLLEVIGDEYEQAAPAAVGLAQYEGGKDVYLRRVRRETTLELTPEEIHERGKQAVADIAARMEAIRNELGYKGTAKEFLAAIKTDERFLADSPEEVDQIFMDYIARIEPKLDGWFRSQPKAAYGVRRLPLAAEAGMTYGYYNPPTAADPVGYYNYNASDLDTRSMIWAGSLIYHELLPGHHFHLATQAENQSLQDLRKKYSVAAYTEGWAEYAASLGIEMGMYETPEELYGRYIGEMFLASRLVVDTGMNYLGWSLQQARDFMADYVVQSESEIASETLRYSTSIPAQALAYRLGYEKCGSCGGRLKRLWAMRSIFETSTK